jgi:hypothetical protein
MSFLGLLSEEGVIAPRLGVELVTADGGAWRSR